MPWRSEGVLLLDQVYGCLILSIVRQTACIFKDTWFVDPRVFCYCVADVEYLEKQRYQWSASQCAVTCEQAQQPNSPGLELLCSLLPGERWWQRLNLPFWCRDSGRAISWEWREWREWNRDEEGIFMSSGCPLSAWESWLTACKAAIWVGIWPALICRGLPHEYLAKSRTFDSPGPFATCHVSPWSWIICCACGSVGHKHGQKTPIVARIWYWTSHSANTDRGRQQAQHGQEQGSARTETFIVRRDYVSRGSNGI